MAILALPTTSRKENGLMVNVLQRSATIIVQNSTQEAFGLPATEGMWKRAAVLGTRARGLRLQIRNGLEGRINEEPENPDSIMKILDEMLRAPGDGESWGARAQRHVHEEFLIFTQLRRWLRVLADCVHRSQRRA